MCHCLSFIAIPQRVASWSCYLKDMIDRIIAYNGPFTELQLYHHPLNPNPNPRDRGRRTLVLLSRQSSVAHPLRPPPSMTPPQFDVKRQSSSASSGKFSPRAPRAPAHGRPNPRIPKKASFHSDGNNNGFIRDVASLFSKEGEKGTNQDAMIVLEDFGCLKGGVFCGVFDGHGPHGHTVAQMVRDFLPQKLASNLKSLKTSVHEKIFLPMWKELFLKSFMMMDQELQQKPNIDCFCSGTTAVTLVKEGNNVVIGNLGDSRAILGTKLEDESLVAVQLTVDLKPNLPQEAERIRRSKGRVFALEDEPGVYRVWLPNEDSPGLAMARAFGDFCLKSFGVNSVPEVSYHELTERDEFIVLATDGVWDVLSNEEVVKIVSAVPSRTLAAGRVVEKATKAWRQKYPTSKADDCAVICLFLNGVQSPASMTASSTKRAVSASRLVSPKAMDSTSNEVCSENIKPVDAQNWRALDGVSRVNTLVKLPRYIPNPP